MNLFSRNLDLLTNNLALMNSQALNITRSNVDSQAITRSSVGETASLNDGFYRLRQGVSDVLSVFQPFTNAIKSAGEMLVSLAKTQFNESLQAETEDIQAIGQIQSATKDKLSFQESFALFKQTKQELASAAAILPFSTRDYVLTFKQSIDSIAQGISGSRTDITKEELTQEIRTKGVEVSKLLTLQAKTTNTSSVMAAKVFGQFLGGQLNLQSDFFQANSVFKNKVVDESVKLGAKKRGESVDLKGLSESDRYLAFTNALKASISPEMLSELENSLSGALEGLKSLAQDNTTGILGFNRVIKTGRRDAQTGKEIDTFYGAISSLVRPLINSLSSVLSTTLKLFDPLQAVSVFMLDKLQNWATSIRNFGSVFSAMVDDSLAKGMTKIQALQEGISVALRNAFGIDIKPIDVTPESIIPMFQKWVSGVIQSLAAMLDVKESREAMKNMIIFAATEVLVPYISLMGEAVVAVFKKDALAGVALGATVLQPVVGVVGSLGNILGGFSNMLVAVNTIGAASILQYGLYGLALIAVTASIYAMVRAAMAFVDWWEYRPVWMGGKGDEYNKSGDEDIIKDGVMTKEMLEKSTSYQNRKKNEASGLTFDKPENTPNPLATPNTGSGSETVVALTESDDSDLVPLNPNDTKGISSQNNSKNTVITNYFTVNTSQDAETVAQSIMSSFIGATAGITSL